MHLGQGEESLCHGRDILQLSNRVNAALDGLGMFCACTREDALDARNVVFSPFTVRLADDLVPKRYRIT